MAIIQSHYEINVSLNGKHFFATAERSAVDKQKALEPVTVLRTKFPQTEGYSVTCVHIACAGKQVNF